MKTLFEVTNGYTGESYVRCYAWAESEERALELARAQYETEFNGNRHYSSDYLQNLSVRALFNESSGEFATPVTSDGDDWGEDSRALNLVVIPSRLSRNALHPS